MTDPLVGWDIDGPVCAKVLVVWPDGDRPSLTGPCGPAPWLTELGAGDHPVDVVDRIVRDVVEASHDEVLAMAVPSVETPA